MKANPVKTIRRISGLTQAELADILGCVRLTVHALESGKLKLSDAMAEKICLHTGVSQQWLLDPKRQLPPVCERDVHRPYTVEAFHMTRAEISDPRIEPLDVVTIAGVVSAAYRRLCDAAWQAYREDKIVYFYYLVLEFLRELENRWKDSRKLPDSADVGQLRDHFAGLMEQTRTEKAKKIRGK
jgi:DNA-binding XRE family transcriptional regulator